MAKQTETESNENWMELTSFAFKRFSQPFLMNSNKFVIASYKNSNGDGIYQFDTNKNEWIKIFDYDKNLDFSGIYSSAYDTQNKLLHIRELVAPSKTLIFDLNTKNKVIIKSEQYNTALSSLILIENKLHQICTASDSIMQNGDHYAYDINTKQYQKITTFKPFDGLIMNGLIHLESQKSIISFGGDNGFTGNIDNIIDSVYEFSIRHSKWRELNIKMPMKLSMFGIVSTKNEQYIIILGGDTTEDEYSDNIFIFNTSNNIFIKSHIKCPKKSRYQAIMMNNSKHDEMSCFGFVNHCYKTQNFINIQLLPQYLIKIICCYYSNEEIHLLERDYGTHWKINVDHILQS